MDSGAHDEAIHAPAGNRDSGPGRQPEEGGGAEDEEGEARPGGAEVVCLSRARAPGNREEILENLRRLKEAVEAGEVVGVGIAVLYGPERGRVGSTYFNADGELLAFAGVISRLSRRLDRVLEDE